MGAGLVNRIVSTFVVEVVAVEGPLELKAVGCGVGREKVVVSGDSGECGDGGMLREDGRNGAGVILRLGIFDCGCSDSKNVSVLDFGMSIDDEEVFDILDLERE